MEYVNIVSKSQISDRQNSFISQVQNVYEITFSEDNRSLLGEKSHLKLVCLGTSLVVQHLNHLWWLRLHTPNTRGTGSIPGKELSSHVSHGAVKKKIFFLKLQRSGNHLDRWIHLILCNTGQTLPAYKRTWGSVCSHFTHEKTKHPGV